MAVYYVNNALTGGLNNGLSLQNAWRNPININWNGISAGDIIYVQRGTGSYNGFRIGKAGSNATITGRIWLVSMEWSGEQKALVTTFLNTSGLDNIGIVGFEMASGVGPFDFGNNQSVSGWFISDCYIHDMAQGGITFDTDATSNNNHIRDITFQDLGVGNTENGLNIVLCGNKNIAEYISFGRGNDRTRIFGNYNIVRNCYAGPMLTGDLEGIDPHIDELQTWDNVNSNNRCTIINLFENFFSYRNELNNSHGMNIQDADNSSSDFGGLIWRGSIMAFHGSTPGAEFQSFDRVRCYNNLFVDGYQRSLPDLAYRDYSFWVRDSSNDHKYINNSFVRAHDSVAAGNVDQVWSFQNYNGTGFEADYNHTYQSLPPETGLNNKTGDPLFTNETGLNYMPSSNSPLISGRYQTLANGAGSNSTTLLVDDARYFVDGFGIAEGDLIKVGSSSWVRIASINYSGNIITLNSPINWSDNDPVILFGSECIGPLEYKANGYSVSGNISNIGNNYSVTVNSSDLVRMVVFYENGIPREPVYDGPYTYSSNGGTVKAKIYPRFVSQNLSVEALLSDTLPEQPKARMIGVSKITNMLRLRV